jgi:hypothetical protein
MPFQKRSPKITLRESKEGLKGRIIVSEEPRILFGDHTIAFIDRGSRHGIAPGQIYTLYNQEKSRLDKRDKNDTPLIPIDFASFLVLQAEETTASVLIDRAERSISPGVPFHAPLPR